LIAGLGNIYVCEALHRAGLSPRRPAASLARKDGGPNKRATLLARVIREVLNEAVAAGGSSLRDHRQTDGALGYFQHSFRVYGRDNEPCTRCGGKCGASPNRAAPHFIAEAAKDNGTFGTQASDVRNLGRLRSRRLEHHNPVPTGVF